MSAPAKAKVTWQSVDPRSGNVVDYAEKDQEALEASYKAGRAEHRLQFGSAVFTVVFAEMLQHNNSGGHRRVIRVSDEPAAPVVPITDDLVRVATEACRKMDAFVEHIEKHVESDANARNVPLRSPLSDNEIGAMMAVYGNIVQDFTTARFKAKYGFNPGSDQSILGIRPGEPVPSYFANVVDQSIFHRKFLSLLGLRNLVLFGVNIFSSMLSQTFSGDQSHYAGTTDRGMAGPAMMKHYTGNVVDLDSVVMRCSDAGMVETVNKNLKKQAENDGHAAGAAPQFRSGKELAHSTVGRKIAYESARTLIMDFIHRFKLTPDLIKRRHLDLPETFEQMGDQVPVARDNSQRNMWPMWLYDNVNVLTFHANVPTMSDVYGALLKAPFHFVDAYLGARATNDVDAFFENALNDSCYNHKWRAIEEYTADRRAQGTIVDVLNKLHQSRADIFSAEFYDADDDLGTNELAMMKRLAKGLHGVDEASRAKRAITDRDVEVWHKKLMEAVG